MSAVLTSIGLLPEAQLTRQNILHLSLEDAWPCFRRTVIGLSRRKPGFILWSVHVGFMVGKFALGQVFLRVFRFSRLISFHRCSMRIYSSITKPARSQQLVALVKCLHPSIHLRNVHCTIFPCTQG